MRGVEEEEGGRVEVKCTEDGSRTGIGIDEHEGGRRYGRGANGVQGRKQVYGGREFGGRRKERKHNEGTGGKGRGEKREHRGEQRGGRTRGRKRSNERKGDKKQGREQRSVKRESIE